MKKEIYVLFFVLISIKVAARDFSDSLYIHLYNYEYVSGNQVDSIQLKKTSELRKDIVIEDLVDSLNTDSLGVYKFQDIRCGLSCTNFMIIDKDVTEIYDILSYSAIIERLLDLNCAYENKKSWIKALLTLHNSYLEERNVGSLLMIDLYYKFRYILPSEKIKEGFIKR